MLIRPTHSYVHPLCKYSSRDSQTVRNLMQFGVFVLGSDQTSYCFFAGALKPVKNARL